MTTYSYFITIAMSLSSHDNIDNEDNTTIATEVTIPKVLASIYTNTFQYVGQKFLNSLMEQITMSSKAKCTILFQLLNAEEYKELSTIYKNQDVKFHIISNRDSKDSSNSPDVQYSSSDDPSPTIVSAQPNESTSDVLQDRYLFIRSFYSNNISNIDRM